MSPFLGRLAHFTQHEEVERRENTFLLSERKKIGSQEMVPSSKARLSQTLPQQQTARHAPR